MTQQTNREALDRQYNLRARHPDFESVFQRWEQTSAEVRQRLKGSLDISFGPTALETVDIFPAQQPNAPVVLFIHGGYWQFLDKHFFSFVAPPLVEAGCTVAVSNYALAPSVGFGEIVRQNQAVVAWLAKNAGEYNGNPNHLVVSGHSAGGHLTASLMTTHWARDFGLPADVLKGGCAVSGLYDLAPIQGSFLNDVLALDEQMVATHSPLRQQPLGHAPMEILVGGEETDGFLEQSENFANHWRAQGQPTRHQAIPNRNHFTVMEEMATREGQITQAVLRLVRGETP